MRCLLGAAGDTFPAIGAAGDQHGFAAFYRRCRLVTERLWPTLIEPLRTREQARRHVVDGGGPEAAAAWRAMVDEPIGYAIADAVGNDVVRGVIATDALIGTFARLDDQSLRQNICFLYHVLGGGTGDWDVPVGGMGAVTAALAAAAVGHGAEIATDAEVHTVEPDGRVRYRAAMRSTSSAAGSSWPASHRWSWPGCSAKHRPSARARRSRSTWWCANCHACATTRHAEQAFAGTFHANETWTQLDTAYSRAAAGQVPNPLPCEAYCHSLTDPSILSPGLRDSGAQTMTVFGLHTPHSLFAAPTPTCCATG